MAEWLKRDTEADLRSEGDRKGRDAVEVFLGNCINVSYGDKMIGEYWPRLCALEGGLHRDRLRRQPRQVARDPDLLRR